MGLSILSVKLWWDLVNLQIQIRLLNLPFYSDGLCSTKKVIETLDNVLQSPTKSVKIFEHVVSNCEKLIASKDSTKLSDGFLEEFNERVNRLKSEGGIDASDMMEIIQHRLKEAIKLNEAALIEQQIECYSTWNRVRQEEVEKQVKEMEYNRRKAVLELTKKELLEKEERLNFFDNLDQWELKEEQNEEERKLHAAKMTGSGKKLSSKMLRQAEEDSYVPPDIVKEFKSK